MRRKEKPSVRFLGLFPISEERVGQRYDFLLIALSVRYEEGRLAVKQAFAP